MAKRQIPIDKKPGTEHVPGTMSQAQLWEWLIQHCQSGPVQLVVDREVGRCVNRLYGKVRDVVDMLGAEEAKQQCRFLLDQEWERVDRITDGVIRRIP